MINKTIKQLKITKKSPKKTPYGMPKSYHVDGKISSKELIFFQKVEFLLNSSKNLKSLKSVSSNTFQISTKEH